jgi:hypothetical protein
MAPRITIKGKRPKKGKRLTRGTRWRILAVTGRKREFVGTLLHSFNLGRRRIAIFSVPKA